MLIEKDIQDDSELFAKMTRRPLLALPTVFLWVFAALLWVCSTVLSVNGILPYWLAFFVNAWATFLTFTVMHDASHRAISTHNWVNRLFGELSVVFLTPTCVFAMFRFVHMQHHRFTNQSPEVDPDHWVNAGPKWLLPFKWCVIDLYYYVWYIPRVMSRPKREQRDLLFAVVLLLCVLAFLFSMDWFDEFLLYHFLPARLTAFMLAFGFDFLPHHPHKVSGKDAPYQATNLRLGMGWLMTPIFMYQNYHLAHHLYPLVPFYRYAQIFRAKKRTLIENKACVVTPLSIQAVDDKERIRMIRTT